MSDFEVPEAIICSPFEEPTHYYPDPISQDSSGNSVPKGTAIELKLVSLIRSRVKEWRASRLPASSIHARPSRRSRRTPAWASPSCYIHNGQAIFETKGFDDLADVKTAAAERWVAAVNADGRMGTWHYSITRKVDDVRRTLDGWGLVS